MKDEKRMMKCAICGKRVLGIVKVVHMWRHLRRGETVRLVKADGKVTYCQVVPAVLNAEGREKDEGGGMKDETAVSPVSARDENKRLRPSTAWLRDMCDAVSVDWFLRL